jgi:hypothetical protein
MCIDLHQMFWDEVEGLTNLALLLLRSFVQLMRLTLLIRNQLRTKNIINMIDFGSLAEKGHNSIRMEHDDRHHEQRFSRLAAKMTERLHSEEGLASEEAL